MTATETEPALLVVAVLFGLAHAGHCAGMCGAFAITAAGGRGGAPGLLVYLLGKAFTYVFLGALAGALGASVVALDGGLRSALGWAVGLALLLAGARLLAGPPAPGRLGAGLSRLLAPAGAALGPGRGLAGRFAYGAVTGALPCGVVYLAALQGVAAGGAAGGALFMAAFGAGTAPVLLVAGLGGRALLQRVDPRRLRLAGAMLVLLAGLLTLWRAGLPFAATGCPTCSP